MFVTALIVVWPTMIYHVRMYRNIEYERWCCQYFTFGLVFLIQAIQAFSTDLNRLNNIRKFCEEYEGKTYIGISSTIIALELIGTHNIFVVLAVVLL